MIFVLLSLLWDNPPSNLEKIVKEVSILEKVMETSFEMTKDQNCHECDEIEVEGTYLANQGVVLVIDQDGRFPRFSHLAMPNIPRVIAPVTRFNFTGNHEEMEEWEEELQDLMEDYEDQVQDSIEIAADAMSESLYLGSREAQKQFKEAREQYSRSMSEARKKWSDARGKIRSGKISEADRKTLETTIKEAQDSLDRANDQYQQVVQELRTQEKQSWEKKQAVMNRQIAEILCDYGSSLRSIPNDQHITVIFRENDHHWGNKSTNRIMVFKKSDLVACRDGQLSRDALISKAIDYSF